MESLKNSAQKLASEIATKTVEKRSLETELNEYIDQLLIKEAKIEVLQEKKDELHSILSSKKKEKSSLFDKREELIEKKRLIQQELYDGLAPKESKDTLTEKIAKLSENIGEVIDQSKKISEEMQKLYEETQIEQKKVYDNIQELNLMKRASDDLIMSYKKKIADADIELSNLRRKVSEIQNKLEKYS